MPLFRVELSIVGVESSKAHYTVDAPDLEAAKADAKERYYRDVLPTLVVASWEGPIEVLKATSSGNPGTS